MKLKLWIVYIECKWRVMELQKFNLLVRCRLRLRGGSGSLSSKTFEMV